MTKKIISLALALIMCLALVPVTVLAASTCEKIENTYANAAPLSVGSKVEVGKEQIGIPPGDVTYFNVNYKYSFTLTDPSLVTVTLTTENPPTSEYKPNYLGLKLICADEKTEIIPLDRSRSDYTEVHSGKDRLSDNMSYKLLPGKYYLWMDSRTSNNAYGWVQINSVTATQEDFGGEPNDTTLLAQAKASIGTGVDYKGNISYEGNKEGKDNYNRDRWDYYRFDVPSDGYGVKLTVSRADTTVVNNIEAYLCDVNANSIKPTISLKDTPTGSVEYKNLKKDTYFVLIDGWPTTALETEYTFRLDPLDGSAATQPPATTTPPVTQPPVTQPPASTGLTATPTASTVLVNGKNVAFDAYNIGGNNYFKLRDLAYTLNGTAKQFSVGWDGATNSITLTSGQGYTATGGEMSAKGGGSKTAVPTTSKIIKDGATASFTAYNIDGNNYFKLRDIGQAFNFGVDWDGAKNTIVIDTGKGYAAEGQTTTPPATTEPPKTDPPATTEPPKPTDPPTSGSVDSKIVGQWSYTTGSGGVAEIYTYKFDADGTFTMVYSANSTTTTNGKFHTDNGTLYLTNLIFTYRESNSLNDKTSEYSFGSDANGEYLSIKIFSRSNTTPDSNLLYKFYKK